VHLFPKVWILEISTNTKAFRISGSVSGCRLKAVFGYPYPVATHYPAGYPTGKLDSDHLCNELNTVMDGGKEASRPPGKFLYHYFIGLMAKMSQRIKCHWPCTGPTWRRQRYIRTTEPLHCFQSHQKSYGWIKSNAYICCQWFHAYIHCQYIVASSWPVFLAVCQIGVELEFNRGYWPYV